VPHGPMWRRARGKVRMGYLPWRECNLSKVPETSGHPRANSAVAKTRHGRLGWDAVDQAPG
jgi:hypothetical protein